MTRKDTRREGDERPVEHDEKMALTFTPATGEPFRWLPRHGEPSCVGEWISQNIVSWLAVRSHYIGVIVTVSLIVQLLTLLLVVWL